MVYYPVFVNLTLDVTPPSPAPSTDPWDITGMEVQVSDTGYYHDTC